MDCKCFVNNGKLARNHLKLTPHGSGAFSYLPPKALIASSSKKGISCEDLRPWMHHELLAYAHLSFASYLLLCIGEARELLASKDGFARIVHGLDKCPKACQSATPSNKMEGNVRRSMAHRSCDFTCLIELEASS